MIEREREREGEGERGARKNSLFVAIYKRTLETVHLLKIPNQVEPWPQDEVFSSKNGEQSLVTSLGSSSLKEESKGFKTKSQPPLSFCLSKIL